MKSPILPHTRAMQPWRTRVERPLWKKEADTCLDELRFVWTLTQQGKVVHLTNVQYLQSVAGPTRAEFRLRPQQLILDDLQCHEVYRVPIQIRNCGPVTDRSRITKVELKSGLEIAQVRFPPNQRSHVLAPGLCTTIPLEFVFLERGDIQGAIEIQTRMGFHTIPITGHVN